MFHILEHTDVNQIFIRSIGTCYQEDSCDNSHHTDQEFLHLVYLYFLFYLFPIFFYAFSETIGSKASKLDLTSLHQILKSVVQRPSPFDFIKSWLEFTIFRHLKVKRKLKIDHGMKKPVRTGPTGFLHLD